MEADLGKFLVQLFGTASIIGSLGFWLLKYAFNSWESSKKRISELEERITRKTLEDIQKIVEELRSDIRSLKDRIDDLEKSYITLPLKLEAQDHKTDKLSDAIRSMTQLIDIRMKSMESHFGKVIVKDPYNPMKKQ